MKKMKKVFAAMLILVLACSMLSGCGTKEEKKENEDNNNLPSTENNNDSEDVEKNNDMITLGVCQLVKHAALDASYEGFVDGLKEAGYESGKNLEIIYDVAGGEKSNCQTIANKLANKNVNLILAIATDAAQACANATKDIPIFVTAVTDPESSGIVITNSNPGGNVTGTSDLTPVKRQMELLVKLFPDAKKVAILYCSSESNSQIQGDLAVKEAEAVGLEVVIKTVSQTSEIQTAVESLVGKVDVLYAPTDNMIAANMETVAMIANSNKLPIIVGEEGMVEKGGLATYGINYYNLGKQTAAMAVKVLKGEADTATMPIEYLENTTFSYNKDVADMLGIIIPEDLLAEAATE